MSPFRIYLMMRVDLHRITVPIEESFRQTVALVAFPTRYLGSKSFSLLGIVLRLPAWIFSEEALFGSGYHRFDTLALDPERVKKLIKYAALSGASHSHKFDLAAPFGYKPVNPHDVLGAVKLPETVELRENCLFDRSSGLKVTLFQKGEEVVIGIGALDSYRTVIKDKGEKDKYHNWLTWLAVCSLLGYNPTLYDTADSIMAALLESPKLQGKTKRIVGQCFGANVGTYLSLRHNVPATLFNSLPLGPGLQQKIGKERLSRADDLVTHIIVEGDQMADTSRILGVVDMGLGLLGLRTAGNFGCKATLPSAYNTAFETHRFVIGSMMSFIGLDCRTLPKDLDREILSC